MAKRTKGPPVMVVMSDHVAPIAQIELTPVPVAGSNLPAIIPGETVIDATPTPAPQDDTATIAANINAAFIAIDTAERGVVDARIAVGKMLLEAKERVTKAAQSLGGDGKHAFPVWFKRHIKRSKSDIYKCMALASAPDPAAARAKEKATSAAGMKTTRAKQQSQTLETAPTAEREPTAPDLPAEIMVEFGASSIPETLLAIETLAKQLAEIAYNGKKQGGSKAVANAISAINAFMALINH